MRPKYPKRRVDIVIRTLSGLFFKQQQNDANEYFTRIGKGTF